MKIQQEIRQLSNPELVKHCQKYFKTGKGDYGEGDVFLGIRVPTIRKVAKKYCNLESKQVLQLIKSKFHEERLAGLIILVSQYEKAKTEIQRKKIYDSYVSHFKYINNWDLVDVSCHKIIGRHLYPGNRTILYAWARSKNLWVRRISIISTFWFIRNNDLKDTLVISRMLLNDKHDLIHKAVGWALREVGKKDRMALQTFLLKYAHQMPRTTLRYAIEKFPQAQRQYYLSSKFARKNGSGKMP